MSVQELYTNTLRQTQEAWVGAIESYTTSVQKAFGQPTVNPFELVDPSEAIDQVFDFWGKALEVEREFAKTLAKASYNVGQAVRHQAESVTEAVREQAESVSEAVRQQVEQVSDAAREQAEQVSEAARAKVAGKYDDLTKPELQEELARRDLPKTGNVDELRARLIEDDLQ
jgi:methyl-accepting chemotaxis protein